MINPSLTNWNYIWYNEYDTGDQFQTLCLPDYIVYKWTKNADIFSNHWFYWVIHTIFTNVNK